MSTMAWILVGGAAVFIVLGIYVFCAAARIFVSDNKQESHPGGDTQAPPITEGRFQEKRSGGDRRKSQQKIQFPYITSDGTVIAEDRRVGDRRTVLAI